MRNDNNSDAPNGKIFFLSFTFQNIPNINPKTPLRNKNIFILFNPKNKPIPVTIPKSPPPIASAFLYLDKKYAII